MKKVSPQINLLRTVYDNKKFDSEDLDKIIEGICREKVIIN